VKDMLQSLNRADIQVVSMPEFLALGTAMKDMEHPSRLVIGTNHLNVVDVIKDMYRYDERTPYVVSDPQTAEFIKYASNALLATKVSFINEMSQISEAIGANISTVLDGLSLDPRIGKHFLQPGLGFGGSCFPKDLKALKLLANDHHLDGLLLEATLKANKDQTRRFTERVLSRFKGNIKGKKIAILGLSYKGATADVRNSPAFTVIDMLTDKKAIIFAYDKRSTIEFFECRGEKPCLAYANVIEDALDLSRIENN
jgi:UDPglucose 6-dehydrogenase